MRGTWKSWYAFGLSTIIVTSAGAGYRNARSGTWGPVRVETGSLLLTAQDLSIQALPDDITFSRAYSPDVGWTFLVEQRADVDPESGDVTILSESGRKTYQSDGEGGYQTSQGTSLEVEEDGTVRYTDRSLTIYLFSPDHGGIVEISDPFGHEIQFSYQEIGGIDRLTAIEDDERREVSLERNPVTGVIDALSFENDRETITTTYQYDASANLVSVTDPEGHSLRYAYGESGRMSSRTNKMGATWNYTYDDEGRVTRLDRGGTDLGIFRFLDPAEEPGPGYTKTEVTDADGGAWLYVFDRVGNILGSRNALGGIVRQKWHGNDLSRYIDELGNVTLYPEQGVWDGVQHADGFLEFWKDNDNGQTKTKGLSDPVARDTLLTGYEYDEHRLLAAETDPDGQVTRYTYRDGQRYERTRRNGSQVVTEYDDAGRLEAHTDGEGNTWEYSYDDAGNLVEEEDSERNRTSYTYDGRGRRTTRETEDRGLTRWTYGPGDEPETRVNAHGGITRYEYDTVGRLVSTVDPVGNETRHSYDAYGDLISTIDPLGGATIQEWDLLGRLVSRTHPNGSVETFSYDVAGSLVAETDAGGSTWTHEIDSRGRRVSTTDPLEHTTRWSFDGRGNVVSEGNALDYVTSFTHTRTRYPGTNWRITTETNALGEIHRTEYDAEGWVVGKVDPDDAQVRMTNDGNGRISGAEDALGATRRVTRNRNGDVEFLTNWNGYWSSFAYDRMGRIEELVDPVGIGNRYALQYDLLGQVVELEDPSGDVREYVYDDAGNTISEIDGEGNETSYTHDGVGNILTRTDPSGATESWTYGNTRLGGTYPILSSTDPTGAVTRYELDGANRVIARVDPNGGRWSYRYDEIGRIESVTDPLGAITAYEFDAAGQLAGVTNGRGATVSYGYDPIGRLVSITDPVGGVTRGEYDVRGGLVRVTWPDATETLWTRDVNGRPLVQSHPDGSTTNFAAYDAMGNLLEVNGPDGTHEIMVYDRLNRCIDTRDVQTDRAVAVDLAPEGHVLAIGGGAGHETVYRYDGVDRLVSIEGSSGFWIEMVRDENGRVVEIEDDDGNETIFEYDPRGGIESVMHEGAAGLLAQYDYEYDPNGNVIHVTESLDGAETQVDLVYDSVNRLVEELYSGASDWSVRYTYDDAGNRVREEPIDGETVDYTYDLADRLVNAGPDDLIYDARGRMVERISPDPGRSLRFSYDGPGRLATIMSDAAGTWDFGYSAMGLLRSVTDPEGSETVMEYAQDRVIAEYVDELQSFAYTLDPESGRHIGARSATGVFRYHDDGLANLGVVSENGSAIALFAHTAFGRERVAGGQTQEHVFRFTGSRLVDGPGVLMYRDREYILSDGRFTRPNPALDLPDLVSQEIRVASRNLVTTPTQFVLSRTAKSVFDVDVARIQPGMFNQYAFSLNNPAAFRSALGTEKLERQSVVESPWKWYLLLQ